MVKIGLKHKTHVPKLKKNRHTSYSMMSAIKEGFNIVFYSQTHKYMPMILHQSQGIRVILKKGMDVIFNSHLVNNGGKSRFTTDGELLSDDRLFYYVWNKKITSQKEDGSQVYRKHIPMCSSYQSSDWSCVNCQLGVQSVIDLSNMDITNVSEGELIVGNLEYLGWVVVKGVDISINLQITLKQIMNKGKWFRIGKDHGACQKFNSDGLSKYYRNWIVNEEIQEYCDEVLSKVIIKCLHDNEYEIGYRNIISNQFIMIQDQIPHTDYKVSMK